MRLIELEYCGGLSPRSVYEIHAGTSEDTLELQGYADVRMIGSGLLGGKCSVFDGDGRIIGTAPVEIPDGSSRSLRQAAILALRRALPPGHDIA